MRHTLISAFCPQKLAFIFTCFFTVSSPADLCRSNLEAEFKNSISISEIEKNPLDFYLFVQDRIDSRRHLPIREMMNFPLPEYFKGSHKYIVEQLHIAHTTFSKRRYISGIRAVQVLKTRVDELAQKNFPYADFHQMLDSFALFLDFYEMYTESPQMVLRHLENGKTKLVLDEKLLEESLDLFNQEPRSRYLNPEQIYLPTHTYSSRWTFVLFQAVPLFIEGVISGRPVVANSKTRTKHFKIHDEYHSEIMNSKFTFPLNVEKLREYQNLIHFLDQKMKQQKNPTSQFWIELYLFELFHEQGWSFEDLKNNPPEKSVRNINEYADFWIYSTSNHNFYKAGLKVHKWVKDFYGYPSTQ